MDAISRLMRPASVAVIGASADPAKTAGKPVAFLLKHGFSGAIYPVNPRVQSIGGLRCYPDIQSLPGAPDAAIILLGAAQAASAVRALAALGTPAAVVLAGGYAEAGAEGARLQFELREAAGAMRLLGPNTIGLVNLTDGITLSASGALDMDVFPKGNIGIVSQSGGILGALLSRAAGGGVGLSKLIATGNEADLDLADFIDCLADDTHTRVIALYIESVRNPEKFAAAALKAARAGKPVVAYKIGRSEAGARAAVSHTGALAGSDRMYDAYFHRLGIIRARRFGDLLDICAGLSAGRFPRGNRVAVLTSTGGAGTLVVDALGAEGFEAPAPDAAAAAGLRALIGGGAAGMDANPVDVTLAGLQPDILRGAIRILLASESYDALIIIVGSSGIGRPELMADAIAPCLEGSAKPVIAYLSPHAPAAGAVLTARGVPCFTQPEACAAALDAMRRAAEPGSAAGAAARADISLEGIGGGRLDEAGAKALFARFGVPCAREKIVSSPAEAEQAARGLGGRVALKILSADITHKSDIGGVALGVTAQDIAARMTRMAADVKAAGGDPPRRFLAQEMISGGVEMILGFHRDPLGGAILLGMGGTAAELFADTVLRMPAPGCGLTRAQALAMARGLKGWPLLDGYRGRAKADIDALISAIVCFSAMAAQLGERLIEAEINPLFVLAAGDGARAADGVCVLAP